MADSESEEALGLSLDIGRKPASPLRRRDYYLPREWVERALTAVHKPDEGIIHFFDLGPDGRPIRAVCPVCKITWEYRDRWENSR